MYYIPKHSPYHCHFDYPNLTVINIFVTCTLFRYLPTKIFDVVRPIGVILSIAQFHTHDYIIRTNCFIFGNCLSTTKTLLLDLINLPVLKPGQHYYFVSLKSFHQWIILNSHFTTFRIFTWIITRYIFCLCNIIPVL